MAQLAEAVAYVDVYTTMAVFARQHQYVQPSIQSNGQHEIIQGRHPVIEVQLGVMESFIPNDLSIHHHIHVIT